MLAGYAVYKDVESTVHIQKHYPDTFLSVARAMGGITTFTSRTGEAWAWA